MFLASRSRLASIFLFANRKQSDKLSTMSVKELEQSVLKLTDEERRLFLYWVDGHRHELLPQEDDIHPEVKAEILRRRDEVDAKPELLEPWEGTTERTRARLHELRRQKAKVG